VGRVDGVSEMRRRRANGEASREKVLDAAAEVAGERGYEGTTINLISERSGLPPSSIYWHFKDKDDLIAEVIGRSYSRWEAASNPWRGVFVSEPTDESFTEAMQRVGAAIAEFPDFLRLGMMLILERRPDELTARRKFLEVRRETAVATAKGYAERFPALDADDVDQLTTLTMALADGLFVAQEAGEADLRRSFELLATAVLCTADRLLAAKAAPRPPRSSPPRSSGRRR
jgi:AcrR family transcriptional regulator